ncbi:MAG: O-antigen ligase family protein [Candidatus Hodarchaeales archaeon]
MGILIFSPLPAASVEEWAILVIQLAVVIMMVAYFFMKEKPQNNILLSHSLKWPRYLFIGLFILMIIQLIPLPKSAIKILSSNAFSFQNLYQADFSNIDFMGLSLIPSHSIQAGLELLTYFFLGFLIVKTVTRRRQVMRIFSVLIVMGILEAFYGLFELYNKNPRILFYEKTHYLDSVTGTFVNRNHLSGYLEMVIPLCIGLIIARMDLGSLAGLKWREKLLRLSERGIGTNILLSLGIIIMSVAVIFSKSRSGVSLLIFAFILFFGLSRLFIRGTIYQKSGIKKFLTVIFLFILFTALYVGIDANLERFALDKILHEERPVVWANTITIFSDYPLFGTGLGTFASIYPSYEDSKEYARYSHAHNDYLEYLAELGIFGFLFLVGGILIMLINSFLVWKERRHPWVKGLALGSIIAVICMLIHSVTDFNLQIPANLVLFSVVLSLTVTVAFYKRKEGNNTLARINTKSKGR